MRVNQRVSCHYLMGMFKVLSGPHFVIMVDVGSE
jgi:hypothetical protein